MLKVLAIIMGALVVVTRGAGAVSPELARKLMKGMVKRPVILLSMMVVAAVIGGLFLWGFRWDLAHQGAVGWQAYVLLVLGIFMVVAALFGLAVPGVPIKMMTRFSDMSLPTLRLLCLLGVVVGALILFVGVSM